MAIKLLPEHLQTIINHAESTYPEECCGIMLGKMDSTDKTVVEVWQTENAWSAETADDYVDAEVVTSKRRRFAIAPLDMLKAQKAARQSQLNIVGFFHSHPDYPAIPSEFDRTYAWQEYSYIIVSVVQGKAGDIRSWCLDDTHQFQAEEIITFH
ncbi:Mov34/MPN/PAD-1 family protein [Crinalium epipsammum PCC 9333]|uniref:Mov34/MPN/PAD-1 family protein n=1 Tax=Crinalium epipsammum PCC 9333 TaxID=1173022 RepID=K9W4X4_9CYAN|nr:M67 family metallopeptidase [Crinalium epipsammum]AFZ14844.1 Mov34/MPN/PAD-1 family protein [Crinalium epipsammum PCC 9333]